MRKILKLGAAAIAVLGLAACDAGTTKTEPSISKHSQTESSQVDIQKVDMQNVDVKKVVMYKSPNCECCTGWANHLRQEGFTVVEKKRDDMDAIKAKYGVTQKLASCHTAIVDGYVIEGHVPAADVARLLKERPDVVGLTAPGMPMKSPGMQKPGQTPKNYDVLAFDANGTSHVFSHY